MGTRVETANDMVDGIKWVTALGLLSAGIGGFYYFGDQSLLFRVVALLAVSALVIAIALQTEKGRIAWGFVREARTEVRKVVWPTRKETVQTTMIVIVMVAIMALLLWAVDSLLGFLMSGMLAQGG